MKFETPVVDVKKFNLVDVLTASGETEAPATEAPSVCGENVEGPCPDD